MAWYNDLWNYRKKITIPAINLTGDLTDYPVAINLANLGSDFFDNVKSDGSDIRVTLADEITEVPIEVVSINTTLDTGEAYFKAVGTLSSSVNNEFYIYYGNAAATAYAVTDPFGRNNVWDSNFVLVAHLHQNPAGGAPQMTDSTANGNNGTSSGSMTLSDSVGAIAGNGLDFDGANDFINFGNAASLQITNNLTAECWIKGPSDNQRGFFGKAALSGLTNLSWWINSNQNPTPGQVDMWVTNTLSTVSSFNSKLYRGGNTALDNTWRHIALTFASNTFITYTNGSNDVGARSQVWNATVSTLANTAEPVRFGAGNGTVSSYKNFVGDEVRISNVVRSAAWIKATHDNIKTPASFYTIGAQEIDPPILTGLSPALNSSNNPNETNLELTFSKNVTVGTGNVNINQIPNLKIGENFQGKIGEILVINENLSIGDREKIEGYFAWKWFGAVNPLPVNHPYKYRGPGV
jgi:hypothetical protein